MKKLLLVSLLLLTAACDRDTTVNVTAPTPTPDLSSRIEFRVNGNPTFSRIRFSTPVDGLTIVNTILPYSIALTTTQSTIFLSLDATPIQYPFNVTVPFMQVQIFVNGNLFREASSSDFSLNTISVSGTWRK
jgi:hypothetical protein